jgi:hypothetical protein
MAVEKVPLIKAAASAEAALIFSKVSSAATLVLGELAGFVAVVLVVGSIMILILKAFSAEDSPMRRLDADRSPPRSQSAELPSENLRPLNADR